MSKESARSITIRANYSTATKSFHFRLKLPLISEPFPRCHSFRLDRIRLQLMALSAFHSSALHSHLITISILGAQVRFQHHILATTPR